MSKLNFVVLCKFNPTNRVLFDCIDSILEHHKDASITLIDSDSEDKSYFKQIEDRVNIIDLKNKNWMSGAIWHAYENLDFENYFFIQDSVLIKDNLDDLVDKDISSVRYFNSGDRLGGFPLIADWGQGFDTAEQRSFVSEMFKKHTPYEILPRFIGLFGPMMFCKRSVLDKLKENNFDKILPWDKITTCGMERAWGLALAQEGYDIKKNSVCGNHFRNTDETRVKKIFLGRG